MLALSAETMSFPVAMSASKSVFIENDLFFNLLTCFASGSLPMTLKSSARSLPLASSLPLTPGASDKNLLTFRSPLTSRPSPVSAIFVTDNVCLSRFICVSAFNVTLAGELGICLPEKIASAFKGLNLISLRLPLTPTSIDTVRKVLARPSCSSAVRTLDSFSP